MKCLGEIVLENYSSAKSKSMSNGHPGTVNDCFMHSSKCCCLCFCKCHLYLELSSKLNFWYLICQLKAEKQEKGLVGYLSNRWNYQNFHMCIQ